MYYKFYSDTRKKEIDLDDLYAGQSCFLLGGAPSLKDYNLDFLNGPGIISMGINNVPAIIRTNFWVGGDKPRCYDPSILYDISILKFANYGKRFEQINGVPWTNYPATLFYPCKDDVPVSEFMHSGRDISWWKNTWFIAIQILWRLGFHTIYTLGADFYMTKSKQYAWETELKDKEIESNMLLYSQTLQRMRELKPYFDLHGLNIINCSKTSGLIQDFGYIPLEIAIEQAKSILPSPIDTKTLPHCLRNNE